MRIFNWLAVVGFISFLALAWLLSSNRKAVNRRLVLTALGVQVGLAALFVYIPVLTRIPTELTFAVEALWKYTSQGAAFLFATGEDAPAKIVASDTRVLAYAPLFNTLPRFVFFAAAFSLLYRGGALGRLVGFVHRASSRIGLSGAETTASLSNLFIGMESLLLVQPYLKRMSRSELQAMVSVAMTAFAANFHAWRILKLPDDISRQLLSGSLIAMPAALAISKILTPQESPLAKAEPKLEKREEEGSVLEVCLAGAMRGLKVVGFVVAALIAILALVAMADLLLAAVGFATRSLFSLDLNWSLEGLVGLLLFPVGILLGAQPGDVRTLSEIIALRFTNGEIAAIRHLLIAVDSDAFVQPRAASVGLFSIGGFVNLSAFAAFGGALVALLPGRAREAGPVVARALLAATLACLMTGSLVRILTIYFPDPLY